MKTTMVVTVSEDGSKVHAVLTSPAELAALTDFLRTRLPEASASRVSKTDGRRLKARMLQVVRVDESCGLPFKAFDVFSSSSEAATALGITPAGITQAFYTAKRNNRKEAHIKGLWLVRADDVAGVD